MSIAKRDGENTEESYLSRKYELVHSLRKSYLDGKLSDEQIVRLEAIGFDFQGRRAKAAEISTPLIEYLQSNPRKHTYLELSQMFGMSWNRCYSFICYRGMSDLVKPSRRKVDVERLLSDYDNGTDIADLAAKYSVSKDYIRHIIKESGRTPPKFLSDREYDEISELRKQGKSITEIASITGRCHSTVRKALHKLGLAGGAGKLPKKVILQAENLIRQGDMSYREIAEELGMSDSNVSRLAKSIGAENDFQNGKKRTRCIETGEIFPSALDAQRSLCPNSVNGSRVSSAARSGKPYRGFHWEYVSADGESKTQQTASGGSEREVSD